MLHARSSLRPDQVETTLVRAAQQHDIHLTAITHIGKLGASETNPCPEIRVFTLSQNTLYSALLVAEPRMAVVLPWRIAARVEGNEVILETLSPRDFCHWIARDDLDSLALPFETALQSLLDEASRPIGAVAAQARGDHGLGATELQMNIRGALPHRLDSRGTHIEDLAGNGKLDAPGG